MKKGTFRRDLFYRLDVLSLQLAPLRERRDDISQLCAHFLKRYGATHRLTQEAHDTLLTYDWPGNVRELENCIQQMVAINAEPLFQCADLPSAIRNHHFAQRPRHLLWPPERAYRH